VGCDSTINPHSSILRECIAKTRENAIALRDEFLSWTSLGIIPVA
jgi:hypothetical protein